MNNIETIKARTISMADMISDMLALIEKGFMENSQEPLTGAMKIEGSINGMEKDLTAKILELSKSAKGDKDQKTLMALEQMVETFERMGDEAASLVERIEIKVAEKLLFSDIGVNQFNETFCAMKKSIELMKDYLKKKDAAIKERVIDNGFHVKELVERYRREHTDRLIKGVCTPMAANMFFDMMDFTGNLARHASNIVKVHD